MADKKISELPIASALTGTEIVPLVQGGTTDKTTTQDIANLATPDISGLVPYTGSTSDVDLGTHILNAQSVNVKGTGGNGHVGLKHQSADATATGSETVIFAGSDGEPRYKNDGGAVAQFASRAWVTAQGYITNVITALGYTPENVSNKSDSYTASSSTTYASTKAVVDGLATKQNSLGFTPENVTNKQSDLTASSTKYPTVDAVNTGLATKQNTLTDANFGTFSNGLTTKTTPVDADTINISDSADSNKSKKLSLTNLKAFLKTYFDTIYTTTSAVASQITTALSGYATQSWVTSQGYITNVISALGYTPVPTTRTINGYDLSANRTLSASDVSAVASNSAITGATKTKITYDSKGLVTSGADATTADISDSINKRYVTDAQLTVIGNTSGTNTGDETATTIRTKLGITTLSGSNTGDETQATIISKLGYTPQAQFLSKLVFKEQYGGTVTGTTSETLIKTFTFSANELPTDTTLYVETLGYRTGTPTANGTFRLKINTSNTLSGATQIAAWGMGGNTNVHSQNRRRFLITGGNIIGIASGSSLNTDLTTTTTAESINTLDVTAVFYLFVTYTPSNSGDTLNHGFTILKNF